ncbi:hypothetical protein MRB53_011431 [Persea americana]|uniref:Uncharacterized protein n=1 Tax=Persea americana TaxID=3435 RepID=A0ACC2LUR4_PERAE|nr:hypothetical protein MRB53_011431 [Persea americana]
MVNRQAMNIQIPFGNDHRSHLALGPRHLFPIYKLQMKVVYMIFGFHWGLDGCVNWKMDVPIPTVHIVYLHFCISELTGAS